MKTKNAELSSRRDKLDIIVEILSIARRGAPKTRLMYQANMSYSSINGYLDYMLQNRLIAKESNNVRTIYKCTKKGDELLNLYIQITGLFNEHDSQEYQIERTAPPMSLFIKEY